MARRGTNAFTFTELRIVHVLTVGCLTFAQILLPSQSVNDFLWHHHHWMEWFRPTIEINGFSMVLGSCNHWKRWFSMVFHHWSNDGMVAYHRRSLGPTVQFAWNTPQSIIIKPSIYLKNIILLVEYEALLGNICFVSKPFEDKNVQCIRDIKTGRFLIKSWSAAWNLCPLFSQVWLDSHVWFTPFSQLPLSSQTPQNLDNPSCKMQQYVWKEQVDQ